MLQIFFVRYKNLVLNLELLFFASCIAVQEPTLPQQVVTVIIQTAAQHLVAFHRLEVLW